MEFIDDCEFNCGAPDIAGATATYPDGMGVGAVVTWTCDPGTTYLSGDNTRTCGNDENWGGTDIVCQPEDCGDPGTPANCQKTGNVYTYPSTVTFQCDSGYDRQGAGSIQCTMDGTWSAAAPTCNAHVFTSKTELTTAISEWASNSDTARNNYGYIGDWDVSTITDMSSCFANVRHVSEDLSNWDTSAVTTMFNMFNGAEEFNGGVLSWDTSAVTNMENVFYRARNFNGNLSAWDTSAVTTFQSMFFDADAFNGDLSSWDTSAVTNMENVFFRAPNFNGDISSWDVSSVTSLRGAFYGATAFNGDLSAWDTGTCTNMYIMFHASANFNGDVSSWDTSAVTTMQRMFKGTDFDQDLSAWDISAVTDMTDMFAETNSFSGCNKVFTHVAFDTNPNWPYTWTSGCPGFFLTRADLDSAINDWISDAQAAENTHNHISTWDTSRITSFDGLLENEASFNEDIPAWDTRAVTNMGSMFSGANAFNGDVSGWDTSSVTNMGSMFNDATVFNGNVSSWDTSSATTMGNMFKEAEAFNGDVGNWDVGNVQSMVGMFRGSGFDQDLSAWDIGAVTDMANMFEETDSFSGCNMVATHAAFDSNPNWPYTWTSQCPGLFLNRPDLQTAIDAWIADAQAAEETHSHISTWDTSAITDMAHLVSGATMFEGNISAWDVSSVTDMNHMFKDARAFDSQLSSWDVTVVTDMTHIFDGAENFNGNVSTWDISGITSTESMFEGAAEFNGDVGAWDTSGITNMNAMFSSAAKFNGDVSTWNVGTATSMARMFKGATAFNGNVAAWDVSAAEDMNQIFRDATDFNGDVSSWNVQSVRNFSGAFEGATSFQSGVANWDVSAAEDVLGMFQRASTFNEDLNAWAISSTTSTEDLFNGATAFNGDISGWGVSGITNTKNMFKDATAFNTNIISWDVGAVTDATGMFRGATSFDVNIAEWDVSAVVNADHLLHGATSFTSDLSGMQFTSAQSMSNMFTNTPSIHPCVKFDMDVDYDEKFSAWTRGDSGVTSLPNGCAYPFESDNQRVSAAAAEWVTGDFASFYGPISTWNTSGITTTANIFKDATNFNDDLTGWDISTVTSMASAFENAASFQGDLSNWATSNVNTMENTFKGATSFAGDVSNWDVSSVTTMEGLFWGATVFDSDLSGWDVSGVTFMSSMLRDTDQFNQDIAKWNLGSLEYAGDMFTNTSGMTNCSKFHIGRSFTENWDWIGDTGVNERPDQCFDAFETNADLLESVKSALAGDDEVYQQRGTMATWQTKLITDMSNLFANAINFDADLSNWDTSAVTSMSGMFSNVSTFTGDISNWDTSAVTDFSSIFARCSDYHPDISSWDTGAATNMSAAFESAATYDPDVTSWDTSQVVSMSHMFEGAASFDRDISNWDISATVNTAHMFDGAASFNADVTNWDVAAVVHMEGMFKDAALFSKDVSLWNVSNVENFAATFEGADSIPPCTAFFIDRYYAANNAWEHSWTLPERSACSHTFSSSEEFKGLVDEWLDDPTAVEYSHGPISHWDVSAVTAMDGIFEDATTFNYDISDWDTSAVTNMANMFQRAAAFDKDTSEWDVARVTNMDYMFNDASSFDADLSGWETRSVTSVVSMFEGAAAFVGSGFDTESWNTTGMNSMNRMFKNAHRFNGYVDAWDTSAVTDMTSMFQNATAFNQDLSNWDTTRVTRTSDMFHNATAFNGALSNWNVESVLNADRMFRLAISFDQSLAPWNMTSIESSTDMFYNTTSLSMLHKYRMATAVGRDGWLNIFDGLVGSLLGTSDDAESIIEVCGTHPIVDDVHTAVTCAEEMATSCETEPGRCYNELILCHSFDDSTDPGTICMLNQLEHQIAEKTTAAEETDPAELQEWFSRMHEGMGDTLQSCETLLCDQTCFDGTCLPAVECFINNTGCDDIPTRTETDVCIRDVVACIGGHPEDADVMCEGVCRPECPDDVVGDGVCDAACSHEDCNADGGDCMPNMPWRTQNNVYPLENALFWRGALSYETNAVFAETCIGDIEMCALDVRCAHAFTNCTKSGWVQRCEGGDVDACNAWDTAYTHACAKREHDLGFAQPPILVEMGRCLRSVIYVADWQLACSDEIELCEADADCEPIIRAWLYTRTLTADITANTLSTNIYVCKQRFEGNTTHLEITYNASQSCEDRCIGWGGTNDERDNIENRDVDMVYIDDFDPDIETKPTEQWPWNSGRPNDVRTGFQVCNCSSECIPNTHVPTFTVYESESTRGLFGYLVTAHACVDSLQIFPPPIEYDDDDAREFYEEKCVPTFRNFRIPGQTNVAHLSIELYAILTTGCGFMRADDEDEDYYTYTGRILYIAGDVDEDYNPRYNPAPGIIAGTFPITIKVARSAETTLSTDVADRDEEYDAGIFEVDSSSYAYWTNGGCQGSEVEGSISAKMLETIAIKVHMNTSGAISIIPFDVRAKPMDGDYSDDYPTLYANGQRGDYFGVQLDRQAQSIYCISFPAMKCGESYECTYRITSQLIFGGGGKENRRRRLDGNNVRTTTTNNVLVITRPRVGSTSPMLIFGIFIASLAGCVAVARSPNRYTLL